MSSYAFDQAKTEALSALKGALGKTHAPTLSEIEIPRNLAFGDFAFPVFRLAKGMKRNPAELARELAAKIAPTVLIN
mgnify:CR=1 FL=1